MARWFAITEDHLRASGYGTIVDRARECASAENSGTVDPVDDAIQNAVGRVRRAVAPGNVLDIDPTKVPGSFKGAATKLALFDLYRVIGLPLTQDDQDEKRDINSDLKRTADNKLKVDLADDPEGAATFADTGMGVEAVHVPRRQTGRDRTSGL